MTANFMPVRCQVPTKFELEYTVIDRDANQTTKMWSCFGCYHDALEIIFSQSNQSNARVTNSFLVMPTSTHVDYGLDEYIKPILGSLV